MSTTVTYKGNTLTTVNNATKTLKTAGKYMEGDVTLVDDSTTGSVYQDQDGYLVIDDSESSAPQGNLSITANGTYDVAQYAGVDVQTSNTYTVTLDGSGYKDQCWVQVNGTGTKYYTDGDSFTFTDGDYLYIAWKITDANTGHIGTLTVNDSLIASIKNTTAPQYYTVTDPQCDMTIEIDYGTDTNVNLVIPVAKVKPSSITSNGMHSVGGYAFTDVAVDVGVSPLDVINRSFQTFTVPDGVTSIGTGAFYGCTQLKNVTFPSSGLVGVNGYAFYNCSNLTMTSLPNSITTIGTNAFQGCDELALTSLPSGITTIGTNAFSSCDKLALTSLPSGLTAISNNAFYGCYKLALTSLPSGITSIGSQAFALCHSLTLTTLPSSVTSIQTSAFNYCAGLTSISCDGVITTLGGSAFNGSNTYPMALTSASFPNMAVTSNLGSVFGSSTANNACQQLAFCDIGSIAGIASYSFANCYALETLVLRKTTSVCTLVNVNAFLNTPMSGYNSLTGTVYVPSALISRYQTATNWSTLYNAGTVTFAAIEGSEYERD